MVVYDFLAADTKIFWQDIVLWQSGQIPILIGGVDPFVYGMVIPQVPDDLFDEFLVLYEVATAQVKDARFVPVDQVVYLLGEPIVIGNVDDQVGKHLDRFFVFDTFFDFLDPGRGISKDHGYAQNCGLFLGQPHHHILDLDF